MPMRMLVAGAATLVFAAGMAAVQPAQAAQLNDAQIAHVAYTADTIDIKAAQQALKKSHNTEVRQFAQDMIRDHTAVNQKALALLKQLHVKPQDNATSRALEKQAKAERNKLAKLSGPAFDRAYAQNEVAYHQEVNKALTDTLIPSASNPQLKSLLETGLKIFQAHEQHAEHIVASLK